MDKSDFIEIYNANINRKGAVELLEYLEKNTDFFTAPASSKFHGNYEGGLVDHSLAVYNRLKSFQTTEDDESIAICALLHDLCKVNFYIKDTKNVKNERNEWVKQEYYRVDDKLFYGHGEGSVFLIMKFMSIKMDEALAIRWHMSGYDNACKGGERAIGGAYDKYPLCAKLASADMLATYCDEKKI